MPRLAVIAVLIAIGLPLFAQSPDSLVSKLDSLHQKVQLADTLSNPSLLDSLKTSVGALDKLDSAGVTQKQRLDSLQETVASRFDSLKQSYDSIQGAADKAIGKYQQAVDSLTTLDLPVTKLTAKIDSINNWRDTKLGIIKAKADSLRSKAIEKLNNLELPPALEEHAQKLTANLDKLDVSLPTTQLPDLSFKNPLQNSLPGMDNPLNSQSLPGVPNVNANIPQTGLENVSGELQVPKGLSGMGEVGEQVQQVSELVPKNMEEVPKTLEEQATKIGEMQQVSEQLNKVDQHKDLLAPGQDPEAMKKQALEKAKETAIDHFAGKEQQLQEAMQKIAKYKQKYSSVQSIADLPKKRPNPMRGKPLIERVVPGLDMQIHRRDEWLVDFNPYLGYRLTGRLTAGAGWNYRAAYNSDRKVFVDKYSIYGPRIYGEFKAFKGFSGRAEVELMNTYVPPRFSPNPNDPDHREWVFSTMIGMKKEYRFYKNIKGTVFIMYNIYDPHHRSPYGDRLNMRFGFEFPLKKKTKKEGQG